MAAGIRATTAEVIVFVDSDSSVEPDALKLLVQPLADPRVGAVCGHADVLNVRESWITRMQAVRYFVAFRVVKAAESVFGAVTCCSGCFSAYRREAILPRLEWWESQTLPRHRVDLRRRPLADQLRAARLARPLRKARRLAHDRADDAARLHHPADPLEALLDARVAAGRRSSSGASTRSRPSSPT